MPGHWESGTMMARKEDLVVITPEIITPERNDWPTPRSLRRTRPLRQTRHHGDDRGRQGPAPRVGHRRVHDQVGGPASAG